MSNIFKWQLFESCYFRKLTKQYLIFKYIFYLEGFFYQRNNKFLKPFEVILPIDNNDTLWVSYLVYMIECDSSQC